jgi:hypothetical protein
MFWEDYRKEAKKAKVHCGFDINRGIPTQVHLTDGNGAERPFIDQILTEGQTGVMDRGYQSHDIFDLLQGKDKHFVCRIKSGTTRTIIEQYPTEEGSYIFYDALVLLGTPGQNQTQEPVGSYCQMLCLESSGVPILNSINEFNPFNQLS